MALSPLIFAILWAVDANRDQAPPMEDEIMIPQAEELTPDRVEKNGPVAAGDVPTEIHATQSPDVTTCSGGDRDGWRAYFPAAVRKTLKRREMQMKAQYQRRYGRFAGVPVSIVMIIGAILITAAATSAKTITVT